MQRGREFHGVFEEKHLCKFSGAHCAWRWHGGENSEQYFEVLNITDSLESQV